MSSGTTAKISRSAQAQTVAQKSGGQPLKEGSPALSLNRLAQCRRLQAGKEEEMNNRILWILVVALALTLGFAVGTHLNPTQEENTIDTTFIVNQGLALAVRDSTGAWKLAGQLSSVDTVVIEWSGQCIIAYPDTTGKE